MGLDNEVDSCMGEHQWYFTDKLFSGVSVPGELMPFYIIIQVKVPPTICLCLSLLTVKKNQVYSWDAAGFRIILPNGPSQMN